ncbi:MAG: cytochrome P450 [Bacteroidota bacterium]
MPNQAADLPVVPRRKMLQNIPLFVKNPIPILTDFGENYGPTYGLHVGGSSKKSIVTMEPAVVQHILQKKHRNYIKTPIQTEKLAYFVGQGLLTVNGDYWLKQRRLIQPGFHRSRLSKLVVLMQQAIDAYLPQFEAALQKGQTIDIYHHMLELAFSIISRSLFSTHVDEEDLNRLSENITKVQELLIRQVRQPYLEWWFRLSGMLRNHKKLADDSKHLILRLIQQRKASSSAQDDLLDMLLAARYEDTGEPMSEEQLLDEALILFVAGHETSANALAWTFCLLAQHPWAVQKIRQELRQVAVEGIPTFEQLSQLTYLRQVIEEAMRLYPPAWITDRKALAEDQADKYHISKGETVIAFIYGIHRHPALWDNPDAFNPARFSPENKKAQIPYSYLPFGGGPRLCIGNNFAMMEMQLILIALLKQFDFQLVPNQDLVPMPLVTLRPKNGIKMTLQKAAAII